MNAIKKSQAQNRIQQLEAKASALAEPIDQLKEQLAHAKARRDFLVSEKYRMKREDPQRYDRGFFNEVITEENDHISRTETHLALLTDRQASLESEIKFIRLLTRGE